MEIAKREQDGVVILNLSGRLDEMAVSDVETAFQTVVAEDPATVIGDLSGLEYISSSGLRLLLMLSKQLEAKGASLRLCGLSPFVTEVFQVGNFTTIFRVFPDVDSALAAQRA